MSPLLALAPILLALIGPQHGCSYVKDWIDSATNSLKRRAPRNCVTVKSPNGSIDAEGRYALCLVDLDENVESKSSKVEWSPETIAAMISSGSTELLFGGGDMWTVVNSVEYWLGLAWGALAGLSSAWFIGLCCGEKRRRYVCDDTARVYYPAREERIEVPMREKIPERSGMAGRDSLTISVATPLPTQSTRADSATPEGSDGSPTCTHAQSTVEVVDASYQRKIPDLRFTAPVYRGRPKDLPPQPTTPSSSPLSSSPVSYTPSCSEGTGSPRSFAAPTAQSEALPVVEPQSPTAPASNELVEDTPVKIHEDNNDDAPNATVSPASAVSSEDNVEVASPQQPAPSGKSKRHRPPKPERQRLAALRQQKREEEEAAKKAAALVAAEEAST
ncbi:hypothetical protein FOL47_007400 [Perkinsus chesapeaki]|uniref:Uncharacterized protein n=1 Tax=Perkinsus chesapeaki TaxID=330153 RepID=A0A7J6LLR3_PERCH|nr:hypothetical protein FOL47_007400 [Perkinsus chesapeaki]